MERSDPSEILLLTGESWDETVLLLAFGVDCLLIGSIELNPKPDILLLSPDSLMGLIVKLSGLRALFIVGDIRPREIEFFVLILELLFGTVFVEKLDAELEESVLVLKEIDDCNIPSGRYKVGA